MIDYKQVEIKDEKEAYTVTMKVLRELEKSRNLSTFIFTLDDGSFQTEWFDYGKKEDVQRKA